MRAPAAGHLCKLVRSDEFQARFRVAAKRVEGSATPVAAESGVASRSAGFAAAVQDTMVAGLALGRFRGTPRLAGRPGANARMPDELRLFPMISNDFQSIPITFEKMMNPGGVRYMNCDLRAAGAGDGRGSFVRVGAVRLVSSEVSGCREAGGGFGDAGCSRKRRRRSRFAAAVQDTLVAAGDWGRFRGAPRLAGRPAANAIMLDELRLFPMISNQFQSLLIKL